MPNFAAGGVATPADAALMMQLGAETVFVGSGVFKSSDDPDRARPRHRARRVCTTAIRGGPAASEGLGDAMPGLDVRRLEDKDLLQTRGW